MATHNLKSMADELEEMLKTLPRVEPPRSVSESFSLAAEPTQTPEAIAIEEQEALLPELVKSIIDYAIRQAPAQATAKIVGEAIGHGVLAAIDQLKLNDDKVVESINDYFKDLAEAISDVLAE